jgi:hypothetical protein
VRGCREKEGEEDLMEVCKGVSDLKQSSRRPIVLGTSGSGIMVLMLPGFFLGVIFILLGERVGGSYDMPLQLNV